MENIIKKSLIIFVVISGCGFKNTKNNSDINNSNVTPQKNNDNSTTKKYSTCAKSGNKCTEKEIYDGQLVNVKVNDSENYDFYVISDDGTNLTLLKNGSLGPTVAWLNYEDLESVFNYHDWAGPKFGPYTILKQLNNLTSSWTNINVIENYDFQNPGFSNSGYKGLKISNGVVTITTKDLTEAVVPGTSRARLMTEEEYNTIKGYGDPDDYVSFFNSWLFVKLNEEKNEHKNDENWYEYGYYWLLDGNYSRTAQCVMSYKKIVDINVEDTLLLYPVITVDKSLVS